MSHSERHQEKRRRRAKQKAKEGSSGRIRMIEPRLIDSVSPSWWSKALKWIKSLRIGK